MRINLVRICIAFILAGIVLFGTVQAVEALQVTVTATPSSVSAGVSTQIIVTANYYGQPMSGATVIVTSNTGSATLTPSSGQTDSSGRASFRLDITGSTSGTVRVSASVTKQSIDLGNIAGNGFTDVPVQPVMAIPLEPVVLVSTTTPVPPPYQPPAPQPQPQPQPYHPPQRVPPPQPGVNQPPVAVISADKYAGDVPLTVTFDGRQSYAPGGSIVTYTWDFGDRSTGTGYIAQHTYNKIGTFTASLMVTDNEGLSSNAASIQIIAHTGEEVPPAQNPVISATVTSKKHEPQIAAGVYNPKGLIDNKLFFSFVVDGQTIIMNYLLSLFGRTVQPGSSGGQYQIPQGDADDIMITILSPLEGERFIISEPVPLKAMIKTKGVIAPKNLLWNSSADGTIGNGPEFSTSSLSEGNHTISASYAGHTVTRTVRIYRNLQKLYEAAPSQAEIDRVEQDYQFIWADGNGVDEKWSEYNSFTFNQTSPDPSKIVAIAKIDLLRHQQFSEPLPFTGSETLYNYLKSNTSRIYLNLDCGDCSAGGGTVYLSRFFSVWDPRYSSTKENPDSCKKPYLQPSNPEFLNNYMAIIIFIHETRHNEPADPKHVNCTPWNYPEKQPIPYGMDTSFQNGSGYARAALYTMWVYKYGLFDTPEAKNLAKEFAANTLKERFCLKPECPDERVQSIIDELLDNK